MPVLTVFKRFLFKSLWNATHSHAILFSIIDVCHAVALPLVLGWQQDDLVCVLQPVSLLQKLETASQQSAGLRPSGKPSVSAPRTVCCVPARLQPPPPPPYLPSCPMSLCRCSPSPCGLASRSFEATLVSPFVFVALREQGWGAFALDYKVQWPLSIVLSRSALSRYQMLFQHLFFCKHVERRLCNTWLSQQATKELRIQGVFNQWHVLRHRMLHFMQNLTYYMMTEVLEPCWHKLERKLATVKDVDEVGVWCVCGVWWLVACVDIWRGLLLFGCAAPHACVCVCFTQLKQAHDDFLYDCLDQCLLTHLHLELLKVCVKAVLPTDLPSFLTHSLHVPCPLQILTKLTTQCLLFADQVSRLMASLEKTRATTGTWRATRVVLCCC